MNALPRLLAALLLCCAAWLLPARHAAAQSCEYVSAPSVSLGTVGGAGGSSSGRASFLCRNNDASPRTFTVCLFMNPNSSTNNPDSPVNVAPRWMVNWNVWPAAYVRYDLYADPAHTQILGSESSGHTVLATTLTVDGASQANGYTPANVGSLSLYALVPPGQSVAAGNYESQMTPMLHYASRSGGNNPPTAAECAAGPAASNYSTVTAQGTSGCQIGAASDMDFGSVDVLAGNRDQTSAIQLYCPSGTSWEVGLNDGEHADGNSRRLLRSGAGDHYLRYELYQDSAHTRRWGSAPGERIGGTGDGEVQSLTVYGRVPAQTAPAGGDYLDTITVTVYY